jgi:hypothetical protein
MGEHDQPAPVARGEAAVNSLTDVRGRRVDQHHGV